MIHPSFPTRRRGSRCIVLVVVLATVAVFATACGDSGSSSSSATTTTSKPTGTATEKPGVATISGMSVPSNVPCNGKTSTTVAVSYTTAKAKKVEIYVDGALSPGDNPATGSVTVAVHCDGLPHTFIVRALDAAGDPTIAKALVTTDA